MSVFTLPKQLVSLGGYVYAVADTALGQSVFGSSGTAGWISLGDNTNVTVSPGPTPEILRNSLNQIVGRTRPTGGPSFAVEITGWGERYQALFRALQCSRYHYVFAVPIDGAGKCKIPCGCAEDEIGPWLVWVLCNGQMNLPGDTQFQAGSVATRTVTIEGDRLLGEYLVRDLFDRRCWPPCLLESRADAPAAVQADFTAGVVAYSARSFDPIGTGQPIESWVPIFTGSAPDLLQFERNAASGPTLNAEDCPFPSYLDFAGDAAEILVRASGLPSEFTVSFRMRPASLSGTKTLLGNQAGVARLRISAGTFAVIDDGGAQVADTGTIAAGVDIILTLIASNGGADIDIRIDGATAGSALATAGLTFGSLLLGEHEGGGASTSPFVGRIYAVAFADKALAGADLTALEDLVETL